MNHTPPPVLRLENVGYEYTGGAQNFRALEGMTFSIGRGEFVAVVGASGSGKTTLMNLMGLMATVREGTLEIMGQRVNGLDESELAALRNRHLGFVFQEYHLLPRLSVLENVLLPALYTPAHNRSHLQRRAMPLLKKLGMETQARKKPEALSGGQKQRAAICRALINHPELILADEPTGALDSKTSDGLLDLLEELHREGATIVMVTHDQNVAARAHRVITLSDGRIASDLSHTPSPPRFAIPESIPPRAKPWSAAFAFLRGLREAFQGALRTFLAAKLRTALTLVGLVVGVFCVATILGASGELQRSVQTYIQNIGLSSVFVSLSPDTRQSPGSVTWRGFPIERTERTLTALLGSRFDVDFNIWAQWEISLGDGAKPQVTTVTSPRTFDMFRRLNIDWLSGVPLSEIEFGDGQGREGVFLSAARCERLFSRPLCEQGKGAALVGTPLYVRFGEYRFRAPILGFFGVNQDSHFSVHDGGGAMLVTPLTARRLGLFENSWFLSIRPKAATITSGTAQFVKNFFDSYFDGYLRFHTQDFSEMMAKARTAMLGLAAFMTLVAALSILVGGINVMNIMLVTVVERTKEIGLRKAVGAPPRSIRRQFLAEAVILCLAGGVLGVGVAVAAMNGILFAMSKFSKDLFKFHFLLDHTALGIGLATSLATGLLFGIIPAFQASRLDVVDAIRKEG